MLESKVLGFMCFTLLAVICRIAVILIFLLGSKSESGGEEADDLHKSNKEQEYNG
jgi:hypothetical protein